MTVQTDRFGDGNTHKVVGIITAANEGKIGIVLSQP